MRKSFLLIGLLLSMTAVADVIVDATSEIVLATNAPYATRLAAEELNFFMKGVFGEALPVVAERTAGRSAVVLGALPSDAFETNASTGECAAQCGRDCPNRVMSLPRDGFVIEATNGVVRIFGNDDDVAHGNVSNTCWYGGEARWQPHFRRGERRVGGVHSFVTSGAAGASRFGVINDTHAQWDSFAYVAKRFREMKFPVGVWNGDALNCTEERRTAVETFLCPDVPTKDFAAETPLLFLPGNHEYAGEYARQIDEVMPCRPLFDRHGVQLVVAGHVHAHRWDDETGFGWKQVTGGGPEMGYGAGFKPKPSASPTIIEGQVENGQLAVRVYDAWRERLLSERRFASA